MVAIFRKKKSSPKNWVFALILFLAVFDIAVLGSLNLKSPSGNQVVVSPLTPVPAGNGCTCIVGSSPISIPDPKPVDCGDGVIGYRTCYYDCQGTTPACNPTPANLAGLPPTTMNNGKLHYTGCSLNCPSPTPIPPPTPAPDTGTSPEPPQAFGCCTAGGKLVSTRDAGVTCTQMSSSTPGCVPCNDNSNCGPGRTFP